MVIFFSMCRSIFALCVFCGLFPACQEGQKYVPLELTESILQFNDSTFFGWIKDIEVTDFGLLLTDNGTNQIHVLDKKLKLRRTFGKPGEGPGEIKGIMNIEYDNGQIAVQDYTGGKFLVYNESYEFVKQFKVAMSIAEFALLDGAIVSYTNNSAEHSLNKITYQDSVVRDYFGTKPDKNWGYPQEHVIKTPQYLISANAVNRPLLKVYDHRGNHLGTTDFSQNPYIKIWFESRNIKALIASGSEKVRYSQTIFYDVDYYEGKLYLNLPNVSTIEGKRKSILLECQLTEDYQFEIVRVLDFMGHGIYNCFAIVDEGKAVLVYEPGEGALVKFAIPPVIQ